MMGWISRKKQSIQELYKYIYIYVFSCPSKCALKCSAAMHIRKKYPCSVESLEDLDLKPCFTFHTPAALSRLQIFTHAMP